MRHARRAEYRTVRVLTAVIGLSLIGGVWLSFGYLYGLLTAVAVGVVEALVERRFKPDHAPLPPYPGTADDQLR